jgi:hypothetical protein
MALEGLKDNTLIISISDNEYVICDTEANNVRSRPFNYNALINFYKFMNVICTGINNVRYNVIEAVMINGQKSRPSVGLTMLVPCENKRSMDRLSLEIFSTLLTVSCEIRSEVKVNDYDSFYIIKYQAISKCIKLFKLICDDFTDIGKQYEKYMLFTDDIIYKWDKENNNRIYKISNNILIPLCALIYFYNKTSHKTRLRNIFKKVDDGELASFIGGNLVDLDITNKKFGGDFKTEFILGCL